MTPPLGNLPLGGYGAIATLLAGALWFAPTAAEMLCRALPPSRSAVGAIAIGQLRGANSQLGISIAAIVVSFSLMAAMLIMIGSFRGSLESWLADILPADAYVRSGGAGQSGFLDAQAERNIRALPVIARSGAARVQELRMGADQAPITLLARDLDAEQARTLPLVAGTARTPEAGQSPVWISEAAADLFKWAPGDEIVLPLGGVRVPFMVAGVWRDYARQNGTLLIERGRYVAATGDQRINDLWVWLAPGRSVSSRRRTR